MSEDVLISPEAPRTRYDAGLVARGAGADLLSVLAFAVVGRLSHDDGLTAAGLVATAWPFAVGVVGGWAGIFIARMAPLSYPAAAMMLVKTVILGSILRVLFTDGNAPPSFVAVTVVVLGVLFFGWRFAARRLAARPAGGAQAG